MLYYTSYYRKKGRSLGMSVSMEHLVLVNSYRNVLAKVRVQFQDLHMYMLQELHSLLPRLSSSLAGRA